MQRSLSVPLETLLTFMIDVIVVGAAGAHCCQILKSCAAFAFDSIHVTPNTRPWGSRWTRKRNDVAIPNEPPPPPLQAQNRSGCCSASAVISLLSAPTMLIDSRLSQVSPYMRPRKPNPPPRA